MSADEITPREKAGHYVTGMTTSMDLLDVTDALHEMADRADTAEDREWFRLCADVARERLEARDSLLVDHGLKAMPEEIGRTPELGGAVGWGM